MKTIAIFCGSSPTYSSKYESLARNVAEIIARSGNRIVNGGGPGLMKVVTDTVHECKGTIISINLQIKGRIPDTRNAQNYIYSDIRSRQEHIIKIADAFIVLPGGLGTLYETLEVLCNWHLKKSSKKIIFIGSYWKPLIALIDHLIEGNMLQNTIREAWIFIEKPENISIELHI